MTDRNEESGQDILRSRFESVFGNRIRKLFKAIGVSTETSVTISIEGTAVVGDTEEQSCSFQRFCGGSSLSCLERSPNASEDSLNSRVERRVCALGFESLAYSFFVIGVGSIEISLKCRPLAANRVVEFASKNKAGADSGLFSRAFPRTRYLSCKSLFDKSARSFEKSELTLFYQVCKMTETSVRTSVENSILASSYLHDVAIAISAASGSANYIGNKLRGRTGLFDSLNGLEMNKTATGLEKIERNQNNLEEQLSYANFLVGNLLHYFSLDGSGMLESSRREQIVLNEELLQVVNLWEKLGKKRQIAINVDLRIVAIVSGDRYQIRQVLHNVISNAVKYSYATVEGGGQRFVSVSLIRYDPGFRATRVAIRVSNYGIGILSSERALVGKPGFRGRLARAEHIAGIGMGMYISSEILRKMGGSLSVDSTLLHPAEKPLKSRAKGAEAESLDTYLTVVTVVIPADVMDQSSQH